MRRVGAQRADIASSVQTRLFTEVRRRCCFCVYLEQDWGVKKVQIAHISRNRGDNRYANLALLCLRHHDQYDSIPRQSKRFTPHELKHYKAKLIEDMRGFGAERPAPAPLVTSQADIDRTAVGLTEHPKALPQQRVSNELVQLILKAADDNAQSARPENRSIRLESVARHVRVLALADEYRWNWRAYLLIERQPDWLIHGPVEIYTKAETPSWQYVQGDVHSLLMVFHPLMTGTGVYLKGCTCYRVAESGVVPLLSIPLDGYVNGWVPFERTIRTRLLSKQSALDAYRFEADYTVQYRADGSMPQFRRTALFDKTGRLRLRWDAEAGMLLRDGGSLSLADVEGFFYDGATEFLHRNEPKLLRLASGRPLQRRWLAHFLTTVPMSERRRRIARALRT